jgi:predicted enzyme related to lactoylglutathione lyase
VRLRSLTLLASACAALVLADTASAGDASAGHITGVGGIFFKSKDPKALAAWYRDALGIKIEDWGGATLSYDAPGHPPVLVWSAFPATTKYMEPSTREFMVDFAVDDLDALVAKLTAKGVAIVKRDDTDPNGRFAWIVDPDGTKIELWEPKKK